MKLLKRLKRFLILGFFLHPVLVSAQAPQAPQALEADRVVAVVNSEAITQYDLRSKMATVERQLRKQGTPLPPAKDLERQVLDMAMPVFRSLRRLRCVCSLNSLPRPDRR